MQWDSDRSRQENRVVYLEFNSYIFQVINVDFVSVNSSFECFRERKDVEYFFRFNEESDALFACVAV